MTDTSLTNALLRLWLDLSRKRQAQLGLLLFTTFLSGLAEVVSLGSVLPFLGVLTSPERVFGYPMVRSIADKFAINDPSQLVFPVTLVFVFAAIGAGFFRLGLIWFSTNLAQSLGADISANVYRRTLYQPYKVHISRNSSEVVDGVMAKTNRSVSVIQAFLNCASAALLCIFLFLTLLSIDPVTVSFACLIFGTVYGFISYFGKVRLTKNGRTIATEGVRALRAVQEGLGGIRDVLLNNTQEIYCETFSRSDIPLRKAQANNLFLAYSPRFLMEAIGMILIAALAYGIHASSGSLAGAIPLLGALALGAQRLMPAMQMIYNDWAIMEGNKSSLLEVLDFLEQTIPEKKEFKANKCLPFTESLRCESLWFRYEKEGPWVIKDLNIEIDKGVRIGLIGPTGCGKSTLLDLIMGLLEPTEGQITVDCVPISDSNRDAWQRNIANVPQTIFLADSSIAENIALGVPKALIDMRRVKSAAEKAQIAEFIESLSHGYNAHVGEKGIKLSGGQRQRIGIARAFYRDPAVLVFDEATSSLDYLTENAVMESVANLNRDLTIIIVAHRLSTIELCDIVLEFDQFGILSSSGAGLDSHRRN